MSVQALVVVIGIPAGISLIVTTLAIFISRIRRIRTGRRRLEADDRIELATTATAALDAAAISLKKIIEALPGTSTAYTGRTAIAAIDASAQAMLSVLFDLPTRMQEAEESIKRLDRGLKEMRELFNRLGR